MDKIKVKISKEEALDLLSTYYSNILNKVIKVYSKSTYIEGDRPWESDVKYTIFYYSDITSVLNKEINVDMFLSEEEVKNVFIELLNFDDYELSEFEIKTNRVLHESYLYEWYDAEFQGIELEFKSKSNRKVLRK